MLADQQPGAKFRQKVPVFIRSPGFIIALVSFGLGLLWMWAIPPLDAPDEPAHLLTVMQVRKQYIIPQIRYDPGNPVNPILGPPGDPETQAYITKFLDNQQLETVDGYLLSPYEATQPPLYYLAAGLVTQLVPPDPQTVLYLSRLLAVLFGAGAVYFWWLTVRQIAPEAPMWAAAAAGTIALLPQFCFNSAAASNDSTAHMASAAAFYVWFRGLRQPGYDPWMVGAGAMLGLALLSKLTAVALIPGLALIVLFRVFQFHPRDLGMGKWLRQAVLMASGALVGTLLICGWWLVRNIFVYGEPSGMDEALRYYTKSFAAKADFSLPDTAGQLILSTLDSTWGRFGWYYDITLPRSLYQIATIFALFLIALTISTRLGILGSKGMRGRLPRLQWQAYLVFFAIGLLLLIAYIRFNATISLQPQGRYFFIALLPAALLLTGGLHALARGRRLKVIALSVPLAGLAIMNAISLLLLFSLH